MSSRLPEMGHAQKAGMNNERRGKTKRLKTKPLTDKFPNFSPPIPRLQIIPALSALHNPRNY